LNGLTRKRYFDEFKRDAVALYWDTEGATTVIAAELGVREATLSALCRPPGCRSGTAGRVKAS
jgi:transposase